MQAGIQIMVCCMVFFMVKKQRLLFMIWMKKTANMKIIFISVRWSLLGAKKNLQFLMAQNLVDTYSRVTIN